MCGSRTWGCDFWFKKLIILIVAIQLTILLVKYYAVQSITSTTSKKKHVTYSNSFFVAFYFLYIDCFINLI